MTTLREAAQAAYSNQEQERADRYSHQLENLKRFAANRFRAVLGIEPTAWRKNDINNGLLTTYDGIDFWAMWADPVLQNNVILAAHVWTNEDGMSWMTFESLVELGALLAEDADRPADWNKYRNNTKVPA